ncbi:uncharacterized protein LOC131216376 [Anopheles bellator]|uniref:uncharacterized protein LOC131216376 n=1 Tax=Anopheles bellator TaxID=139047 RepID=UPI0026470BFB|nr:uncharacterized protein LOC131216376 [Anopheles bellator]
MFAKFTINGKPYRVSSDQLPVDTSLNTFIRTGVPHLTGTKWMCLEGGCGVCIVHVEGTHPVTRQRTAFSVNSCLFSVLSCHGMDVRTVEGIGSKVSGYHPVQERLAQMNGTQCGFCSPGMVMSMYGLLESKGGTVTMADVEGALAGNICRCTGYRPILDAFKSFAVDAPPRESSIPGASHCSTDIEDLPRSCTDEQCQRPCSARESADERFNLRCDNNRRWYRVRTVDEIFEIIAPIDDGGYILVAGNTGHGVYRRSPQLRAFIDVRNVEELHNYWIGSTVIVGANVPLAEFIEILREAAKKDRRFSYCTEVARHVQEVAHPAVRNVGTIAGNLSLKHQHPEFPSDLFVLFEALGAEMTIVDANGSIYKLLPSQFLGFEMRKRIMLNITLPSLDPDQFVFRSYKVAPRAQNAKAYVNAAFLVRLCARKIDVEHARLCFGGIAPSFSRAAATEQFVKGKNLFNNIALQGTLATLNGELPHDEQAVLPSSAYRRQVAVGLLYRFVLQISPRDRRVANPLVRTGGTPLVRALSSGSQSFDTYPTNWPLTQALPKLEAFNQTAGETVYVNDLPARPDELQAAFVLAASARCAILSIDPGRALALPGVVAFYSAADLPQGVNDFAALKQNVNTTFFFNPVVEQIFCAGRALYHGQPVGIVVATTFALASEAALLVAISYGPPDPGPILPTLADVLEAGATERIATLQEDMVGRAYYRASVGGASHVTGTSVFGSQVHFTLEPQSCLCVPTDDGGLDVYSSSQSSHLVQLAISKVVGLRQSSINVIIRPVGGSYGAKLTRATWIACCAALAVHHTKRPVRMIVPFETATSAIGKRIGAHCPYDVYFDSSGKILKLSAVYIQDFGSSNYESMAIPFREAFKSCYSNGTWRLQMRGALTDAPSTTWLRSPGTAEAIALIETVMEHIAFDSGLDPLAVRLANMDPASNMATLLRNFVRDVDFNTRKAAVERHNETNRWKKRGIAIVPMGHPLSFLGGMNAWVSIYHVDGSVAVTHGCTEMGQGVNTKVAQVTAHILGIPLAKISIKPHSSLSSPNSLPTGGSMGTDMVTYCVKRSCEMLRERIRPVRDDNRTASWEATVQTCYQRGIDLTASYKLRRADIQPYTVWALCCAEVEVDLLTGQVQLPRVDILEDTGESMNPLLDIGQIEGAFMMSLGLHLLEDLRYDRGTGALVNNRTWNYKPPTARDIPIDLRVHLLQKSSNPAGVLRSKATGEPAYNLGVTVAFALRYALCAARRDAGLPREWIELGTSLTVEKILSLAGNTIDQFVLH